MTTQTQLLIAGRELVKDKQARLAREKEAND